MSNEPLPYGTETERACDCCGEWTDSEPCPGCRAVLCGPCGEEYYDEYCCEETD